MGADATPGDDAAASGPPGDAEGRAADGSAASETGDDEETVGDGSVAGGDDGSSSQAPGDATSDGDAAPSAVDGGGSGSDAAFASDAAPSGTVGSGDGATAAQDASFDDGPGLAADGATASGGAGGDGATGGPTGSDATTEAATAFDEDGGAGDDGFGGAATADDSGGATADDANGTTAADDATSGDDAAASDEATADDEGGCDEAANISGCALPMIACGGQCVDPTSDAVNCGGCDNACSSQICQNSQCVGVTTGGIVFIGHDYENTPPATTQARVLTNAVFISQTNPLRVLAYERYAAANSLMRIRTILNGFATQIGRTLALTETVTDTDIPQNLSLQNFDVLLVPDQSAAPSGALAQLDSVSGGNWAPSISTFALNGGVVVVLSGGTGVGEMPAFVSGTGLLSVTAQSPVSVGSPLADNARWDIEGTNLYAPYAAGASTVSVTTEPASPNVIYVILTLPEAGAGAPVVVHKVF